MLARAAEERGYESLFLTEHTHIPRLGRHGGARRRAARREVPAHARPVRRARVRRGGHHGAHHRHQRLPRDRARPDRAGQGSPSLDVLSGGRFVLGVGAGWNKQEMLNHGTDPATRHGNMRERVEAMQAIWRDDEAEYHGKHVDFDPIWQWPKPLQHGVRRSTSAATARASRTACCATATAGCRTCGSSRRSGRGSPRCASGPAAHIPVTYYGADAGEPGRAARRRASTAR